MTTRHYAAPDGSYVGGFDGALPPEGSIETPAPSSAKDTWNGSAWVPPIPTKEQRLTALLAARGLTIESEWQLYGAIAGMQAAGAVSGKTEAQIYAANHGYRYAKDLALQLTSIRAEP